MDFDRIVLRRTAVALALFAGGMMGSAWADNPPSRPEATTLADQKDSPSARGGQTPSTPSAAEQHRLPPDSTTRQTLELPGRTLAFTATAGSIRLFDDKGEPQADIAYTSYQLDGGDRATRPVTFFFNGGPGASSAWLQLGSAGPWRLPINADEVTPSTSPEVKPNAETWLDFTDLVFIDPVGTGYSRFVASGEDVRKRFFSVDGDVSALALVIRRWLEKHDRLLSPKYVVGESYGGIRGPKVVRQLQVQQGVGVNGLIMISPVFDFRDFGGTSLLQYVATLPSYVATVREAKGPVKRADLADVEAYARGEFLTDLVKGRADKEAAMRLADEVATLTGIDHGGEPPARGPLRCRRIPPRARPQERQGDRPLRCFRARP
ncbi:carboxypeptidase C (cathepsin A) [Bradyrhizobium sp. LB7.1]